MSERHYVSSRFFCAQVGRTLARDLIPSPPPVPSASKGDEDWCDYSEEDHELVQSLRVYLRSAATFL